VDALSVAVDKVRPQPAARRVHSDDPSPARRLSFLVGRLNSMYKNISSKKYELNYEGELS